VEGHFARHLRRTSLLYRERRSALVEGLRRDLGPWLQVVGAAARDQHDLTPTSATLKHRAAPSSPAF